MAEAPGGGRPEDPMRDRADAPPRPPRRTPRGGKGGAEPRSVIRRREHQVLTLTEQGWRQEAIADHLGITQAVPWCTTPLRAESLP